MRSEFEQETKLLRKAQDLGLFVMAAYPDLSGMLRPVQSEVNQCFCSSKIYWTLQLIQ